MITRSLVAFGCLLLVLAATASAGAPAKFFLSANGKISCQLSSGGPLGTLAYCQTFKPASSVKLHSNGFAQICKGDACLGNPPDNATTLRAGKAERVGPYFCEAESSSKIQCLVVKSGKGFEVSSTGIKKVTVRES
jgi:hypothetical protein